MDLVSTTLRLASSALPFAGRAIGDRLEQRRITSKARLALRAEGGTEELVESLRPNQATALEQFFFSPQFGHLVLQAMICSVTNYNEELKSAIVSSRKSCERVCR